MWGGKILYTFFVVMWGGQCLPEMAMISYYNQFVIKHGINTCSTFSPHLFLKNRLTSEFASE